MRVVYLWIIVSARIHSVPDAAKQHAAASTRNSYMDEDESESGDTVPRDRKQESVEENAETPSGKPTTTDTDPATDNEPSKPSPGDVGVLSKVVHYIISCGLSAVKNATVFVFSHVVKSLKTSKALVDEIELLAEDAITYGLNRTYVTVRNAVTGIPSSLGFGDSVYDHVPSDSTGASGGDGMDLGRGEGTVDTPLPPSGTADDLERVWEELRKKMKEERNHLAQEKKAMEPLKKEVEEDRTKTADEKEAAEKLKKEAEEDRTKAADEKEAAEKLKKEAEEDRTMAANENKAAEEDRTKADSEKEAAEKLKKEAEEDRKMAADEKEAAEQLKKELEQLKYEAEKERGKAIDLCQHTDKCPTPGPEKCPIQEPCECPIPEPCECPIPEPVKCTTLEPCDKKKAEKQSLLYRAAFDPWFMVVYVLIIMAILCWTLS